MRNTCSLRHRVWEPGYQIQYQMQRFLYDKSHCEGGRVDVQLTTYEDQLRKGKG